MYAIIKTGGKQYRVSEGDVLNIEKLDVEAGSEVVFDEVLTVVADSDVKIGKPVVDGAKVTAGSYQLAFVSFSAQTLSIGITTIVRATGTFFMSMQLQDQFKHCDSPPVCMNANVLRILLCYSQQTIFHSCQNSLSQFIRSIIQVYF